MNEPPPEHRRPFLSATARQQGWEPSVLRRKVYHQVMRGVWIVADAVDDDTVIRSALLLHDDCAYASHLSAAEVLRLPVPTRPFAHVTVPKPELRRYRPQIKNHVRSMPEPTIVVRGIPVTDLATTFIACASLLGLVDQVILGDAMVRAYPIRAAELLAACQRSRDYYAAIATHAARFVRDGVDSPMETRLRMLIVLAGLPEPVVNFRVVREDGTWRRRFDLCYPRIKLIVEYDGRQHAEDPRQWESDLERREEFDDEGYRILVITAGDIYRRPERVLHRIHRQLTLRGWGEVPAIKSDWREYFAA